jgi:HD superfamily phosphohydrolase
MDYLLRDAHYTGLNYGTYDRDYLLHHFCTVKIADREILAIKENALHCVEDFLTARFAWYSQVVRSSRGAKFDALAKELCFYLLERKKIVTYSELLEQVKEDPIKFYSFNDHYFMTRVHELYYQGYFRNNKKISDIAECILFSRSPKTIRISEFKQRILDQDDSDEINRIRKKALEKVAEFKAYLEKVGDSSDWLVADIPSRDLVFTKSKRRIVKGKSYENLLLERDPVKILTNNESVKLLVDVENSIISKLQNSTNFVPHVYCSPSAYAKLEQSGMIG